MEELLSQFNKSSVTENNTNYCVYYKMRGESSQNQEKRRQDLLIAQKEKRDMQVFSTRGILDLIKEAEFTEQTSNQVYKSNVSVPGFTKRNYLYANTLMLSEWMINVPEDLHTNWLVLACPQGTRVLLIANRGRTKVFSKRGYFIREWDSILPGGNRNLSSQCVLDCILDDANKSVYVLDVLAWGDLPMIDCEAEFRNFWLKSKFEELNNLSVRSKNNVYAIHLVQKHDCSIESLNNFFMSWPAFPDNQPPVDGCLFYHRKAHYLKGYTPLVVWLYPFMVHEVLGPDYTVNDKYISEKPTDYINQSTYIEAFEKKMAEKNLYNSRSARSFSNSSSKSSSMDTSSVSLDSLEGSNVQFVFGKSEEINVSSETISPESNDKKSVTKKTRGKKKTKKNLNKNSAGEMDIIADVSTDSAVCFMDDSIVEEQSIECDINNS